MTNTSIGAPASLPVDGKARQFLQMAVQREPLKLPQELVDIIINDLQDDMPTLCCCTLVSREWVFSARRHLFRHVTVYMIRDSLFFMRDTPPSITHNLRYLTLAYGRLRLHDFAAVLSRFPSLHLLRLDNLDIQQTHQSMFIDRRIIPCCTTQLLLDRIALNPQLLELILLYVHASELRISRSCQLRRSPRYYATYAPTREYKLSEDLVDTLRAGHKLERIDLDHQDACELIAKTMQRFPIPLSFSSASFRWIVSGAGRSSLEMVLQGCGPKLTSVALDLTTFYHGAQQRERDACAKFWPEELSQHQSYRPQAHKSEGLLGYSQEDAYTVIRSGRKDAAPGP
ncbi:uncharacterized protein PHACADRAFT_179767 [Phanerochaete carnosa HHB-10118-sp]|uniref:F-box domain-containing protein n=1 Tax=Phanerochaete carnosa (strain HHB-10118-sp) TaxID=650164 RepID=K5XBZ7_PHACS|nr:uncharacterized protein PHACADRAFT_179767 [Phanerochaete carnosa HHB-10118-sp]EKM60512.1 hypothetical protein PHACADRAFT_179767 [Phanerochaete carnosa HHB-10118-sp]